MAHTDSQRSEDSPLTTGSVALDEGAQALLGGGVSPHPVAVDVQRESRVGVPELIHHAAGYELAETTSTRRPGRSGLRPSVRCDPDLEARCGA
jgi:hypothetical protein